MPSYPAHILSNARFVGRHRDLYQSATCIFQVVQTQKAGSGATVRPHHLSDFTSYCSLLVLLTILTFFWFLENAKFTPISAPLPFLSTSRSGLGSEAPSTKHALPSRDPVLLSVFLKLFHGYAHLCITLPSFQVLCLVHRTKLWPSARKIAGT